jgi:polyferredoxin
MVQSSLFPVVLQVGALVVLLLLAFNGLGIGPGMSADELMTIRKTNLTTLVIWGLWWPAMIAVALAFGRAWCTVCPMELVNRVGDTIARKAAWPRVKLGKLLRAGWMIIVLYLAMQLLVAGCSLHRVPHDTSIMLLVLLGGALLTGLVYRSPRSFCKAFCPAGALLSVYGRYTPLQLEARNPLVCERCPTKDCIENKNRYRFDKRSCPSLLRPFNRDPSDGCVLCLQCVKVCPYDNMGVGLVASDAPVRRKLLLRPYEAAFVLVALGFVAHEVIGEVKWLDTVFHVVPEQLAALAPRVPFGWFEALWFLALFPLAVWAAIAGVGYLAGHRSGLRSLLLAAATGAAPVVAIAHLAKAAAKIGSWGGFLPLSLRDPQGGDTFRQITEGSLSVPTAMVGLSVIGWVMLALVIIIAWRAFHWSRQVPAESITAAKVGLVGTAVLFSSVLTIWFLPSL